eukprot:CAMPEP_0202869722 /NCGR_PEP_ID=MMETSP1391-20130828/12612_1 /ASSEMBLY_ACC=CAM_ASM_000867 /TAXON_ID=1034604 /ORGANISM="Chlamydomonas leiostraca, Strain SAG 11-49" /LENGTH=190 /DNA_ID=CAMNT_0049550071 /DNA_START=13 /DNA_END=584 /DNA_ORIENTATION=+
MTGLAGCRGLSKPCSCVMDGRMNCIGEAVVVGGWFLSEGCRGRTAQHKGARHPFLGLSSWLVLMDVRVGIQLVAAIPYRSADVQHKTTVPVSGASYQYCQQYGQGVMDDTVYTGRGGEEREGRVPCDNSEAWIWKNKKVSDTSNTSLASSLCACMHARQERSAYAMVVAVANTVSVLKVGFQILDGVASE